MNQQEIVNILINLFEEVIRKHNYVNKITVIKHYKGTQNQNIDAKGTIFRRQKLEIM